MVTRILKVFVSSGQAVGKCVALRFECGTFVLVLVMMLLVNIMFHLFLDIH